MMTVEERRPQAETATGRAGRGTAGWAGALAAGLLLAAAPLHADDLWDDNGAQEDGWEDDWDDDPWGEPERRFPFETHGFIEIAGGAHTRDNDVTDKDYNLAETRLQLELLGEWRRFNYRVRADGVGDAVEDEWRGELREARVGFPVGQRVDMRVGRQVLSWGTGDLLFVNDLFPKDFESFLTGRDEDYLQAPSDAVRGIWYGDSVTLDVVWTPLFAPDHYVDGGRLSYFDPGSGSQTAESPRTTEPDDFPDDGEAALRISSRVGAAEVDGYAYRGFYPQPRTEVDGRLTHPRLNAYGASVRTPLAGGIGNAEIGYYDSVENRDGDDPNYPNSEIRLLLGYTWELATNLDVGLQYYVEWLQDYDELEDNWPMDDDYLPEERRDVVTTRLTYSMWRNDLIWSLFAYYSPADEDHYLRPSIRYRASDALTYTVGGNFFGGEEAHTFYGQFERDSNVYARARYRF